jgi:hypothetical protein
MRAIQMTVRQKFIALSVVPIVALGFLVLSQLYLPAWLGLPLFGSIGVGIIWMQRWMEQNLRCPHCNGALFSSWPHVSRQERRKSEAFLVGECPHCLGPL